MPLSTKTLPDGRNVFCLNAYEVDFSVHEIFSEDLAAYGIDLPADGVYFDVGANIGLFSLYLHGKCPGATIYAYEPIPVTFEALEKNLRGLSATCHAFQMGLGAAAGVAEFDYFPGITALSTSNSVVGSHLAGGLKQLLFSHQTSREVRDILDDTGATQAREDAAFVEGLFKVEKVRCPIDTVSRELRARGVDQIDLLKIDTEGAEKEILAGIAPADWPKIRQLLVEVHLGQDETDVIARQLQELGYQTSIGSHPLSQGGVPVFHVYATQRATR